MGDALKCHAAKDSQPSGTLALPDESLGFRTIQWELEHRVDREPGMLLVATHGRHFLPTPRPKGVRLRAVKQCYRNAGNFVLEHEDNFWYCEGLAVSRNGHCVAHAWVCPIATSQAIDLTWREIGVAYFGIALDERRLAEQMIKVRSYGPFAGGVKPSDLAHNA